MGFSRSDTSASRGATMAYTASTATKTFRDYEARELPRQYDPAQIGIRESRASAANPNPIPVIIGLDVSGSMGAVVEACRKGLGTLFEQIIDKKVVSDPHVLAMAIGDMDYDRAPVQATQFESEPVVIGKQIEGLFLEGGGGTNGHESYLGPLYFAAKRTDCDAFKVGRKGFLFTVGDEEPQLDLTGRMIERFFGEAQQKTLSAKDCLELVEKDWHYFHIIVDEGSHARTYPKKVDELWKALLGQSVIHLKDHRKLAEVVVATIARVYGRDVEEAAGNDAVVKDAIAGIDPRFGGIDIPASAPPPPA